jgi:hypothetical protein
MVPQSVVGCVVNISHKIYSLYIKMRIVKTGLKYSTWFNLYLVAVNFVGCVLFVYTYVLVDFSQKSYFKGVLKCLYPSVNIS